MIARIGLLAFLTSAAPTGDTPRRHAETVAAGAHSWKLTLGGTVDGPSTRNPIGVSPWTQSFEPMRFVRLENLGDTDVVNPWVNVNGKRRWRTAAEIVNEALTTYGDPGKMSEGEKARALWEYQRRHRFHASTGDREALDPVKLYNVYGYTLCGTEAPVLADLWRTAGLKTRRGFPNGHVVGEVWYDGAWHMMDSDVDVICLKRDNETIASEEEIVRDHDLMKRTRTYGIQSNDSRGTSESTASLFGYEGQRGREFGSSLAHTMAFTLRPGEALEWRWGHVGKHHYAERSLREGWGAAALARLCNGKWTYTPPLRRASARSGVADARNVRWSEKEGEPAVSREKPEAPGFVAWKVETPYPIVGGVLRAKLAGECAISFSRDGKAWTRVTAETILDPHLPQKGPAHYRYFLKVELPAPPGGLEELAIENDLQMAPLSLPALELGENLVAYSDETKGSRSVRVTFDWVERSDSRPPAPPARPVFPADGAEVEGTRFAFEWEAPADPDGDAIADHHFQLSDHPQVRWPLSPNFDKVLSRTAERSQNRWAIPYEGLLNPGKRYYWRLRAKDRQGLWGPWSRVWSFVPRGPDVPSELRWERSERPELVLAWKPIPGGRKPVHYAIYASDEKGFTASDEPYPVFTGNQQKGVLFPGEKQVTFPANRIATSTEPRVAFRPERAFYRVVAVDGHGVRSGPSDYVAAPRPFITSDSLAKAKAGSVYRFELKTLLSIGDLRCRSIGEQSYCRGFWDAEKPAFSLVEGPSWLSIDRATGVLSGTATAGMHPVTVKVEIAGVGADTRSFTLQVEP